MELTFEQALSRGIEAYQAGRIQEADRCFTAILNVDANHADANHNMGALAVGLGELERALPFFRKAIDVNPDVEQFWISYVDTLIELGYLDDASVAVDRAIKQHMESAFLKGFIQKLNQEDVKSTSANHDPPPLELLQLKYLYNHGEFQQAVSQATLMLRKYPTSVDLRYVQGFGYVGLAQLEKALESFKMILEISPNHAEAHNNLATIHLGKGDKSSAKDHYKQAILIEPNLAEAHYNLANIFKAEGDHESAIKGYKSAIKIRPDYIDALNNMGVAQFDNGLVETSIRTYAQILKIDKETKGVWNNLFFALKVLNKNLSSTLAYLDLSENETLSNLARAYLSLLTYRLHLGRSNVSDCYHDAIHCLSKVDSINIKNLAVIKKQLPPKSVSLERVVALIHFGRSGTGLLHSLLDGHSEVSTLPSIYFSEFFDSTAWGKISANDWIDMADNFIATYPVLFDASASDPVLSAHEESISYLGKKEGMANVGEHADEILSVDKKLFREELICLMECFESLDAFAFFKLVHLAYEKALKNDDKKKVIFYHIHNPDTCAELNFIRSAPRANWLMMVREPIQSCESWVRQSFYDNDYASVATKIVDMLFQINREVFRHQNSIGIRLEDLKEYPLKTISALCKWIGIEHQDSLYEMTAQGKKWWGDPSSPDFSDGQMMPFGKASIERKVGAVFGENDQFILRTLFYPFSVRFGYLDENPKQFKDDLKKIRPMIDQIFDFERVLLKERASDETEFINSGSYRYLRSCMVDRWGILNELLTYPNMLVCLDVDADINDQIS